jgi:hypothetical protein
LRLGTVPEVERVYAASRGEVLFVWTVTSDFQRSVRNKIYAIERDLFKDFPNDEFDFNVVEAGEDYLPGRHFGCPDRVPEKGGELIDSSLP